MAGVNVGGLSTGMTPSQADKEIAQARAIDAHVVRLQVPWDVLEPRSSRTEPGAMAFLDALVADASKVRIGVIMTLTTTPCWASSAPPSALAKCTPGTFTAANAWPAREASDYAKVASLLARRYGPALTAIEVWNEPDQINQIYFKGPEKPQHYAALLKAAYPAIKQASPHTFVLAGSLVGSNGEFLKALYQAGIKGYYDGLAVHFYNLVLGSLRSIHEVQLQNNDQVPLWLDEFGWTSCWPSRRIEQEQGCVTKRAQATNLANAFNSLASTPWVAAEVVYKLQDSTAEAFGALNERGAHKPSFKALATVFASPVGKVTNVTLRTKAHDGRLRTSGSGPAGDYMQLEVLQGATPRYRAFFTLNRFNRYSILLPKVLGTKGLTLRVFQYWQGAATAVQRNG